jgi:hypothetical protein
MRDRGLGIHTQNGAAHLASKAHGISGRSQHQAVVPNLFGLCD